MPTRQSKSRDLPADEIGVWQPFETVYAAFVEAHPMLGLTAAGSWSCTNLRRIYGAQLVKAGAAVQLKNARWLAHEAKFGPALFAAMQRG